MFAFIERRAAPAQLCVPCLLALFASESCLFNGSAKFSFKEFDNITLNTTLELFHLCGDFYLPPFDRPAFYLNFGGSLPNAPLPRLLCLCHPLVCDTSPTLLFHSCSSFCGMCLNVSLMGSTWVDVVKVKLESFCFQRF